MRDVSTTGSEFIVTSGHDTVPETSGTLHNCHGHRYQLWEPWPRNPLLEYPPHGPGHRPHLPRPSRQSLETTLAVQDLIARPQNRNMWKGGGVKQPQWIRKLPPMVQQPERHQECCHLALLHSLRHGWGQLAHSNTFQESAGGLAGRTRQLVAHHRLTNQMLLNSRMLDSHPARPGN